MALRPESSVSCEVDEFGELVFSCDRSGPVRHLTPEELGIPRVVVDKPSRPLRDIRADFQPGVFGRSPMRQARVRRDVPKAAAANTVAIPAVGTPGAADLEPAGAEELGEENMTLPGKHARATDKLKAKVLAEPDASVADLVKRLGASRSQVYNWRYDARKKAGGGEGLAAPAARPAPARAPTPVGLVRTIDVDPQRPGTAAALIDALARQDASRATVQVALTQAEVAALIGKLNPAQQEAFIAARIKAALLA